MLHAIKIFPHVDYREHSEHKKDYLTTVLDSGMCVT